MKQNIIKENVKKYIKSLSLQYQDINIFLNDLIQYYHWTDAEFYEFKKQFRWTKHWYTPSNTAWSFFTDNKELALTFWKNLKECFIFSNNTKTINAEFKNYWEFKHELNNILDAILNNKNNIDILIIKNYYDCWIYWKTRVLWDQYVVFDECNIFTKEELIDIYNSK